MVRNLKAIVRGITLGTLFLCQSSSPAFAGNSRATEADSLISTDHTKTWSFPPAADTLVGRSSTDTLSNKTLVAPALGTPVSGVCTNLTGLPLTTGITGILGANHGGTGADTSASTGSPTLSSGTWTISPTTGTLGNVVYSNSPSLTTPNLGTPTTLVGTNITGTASGLTAGNVTTNANLTGPITSVGNATSIASQTGTGTKFVVDTSPMIVTPTITTSAVDPLLIGGTAVTANLSLQSTSGAGTTDYIKFLVGNNGGTEAMRIIDNGNVGIGTSVPANALQVYAASNNPYLSISTGTGSVTGYFQAIDNSFVRVGTLSNTDFELVTCGQNSGGCTFKADLYLQASSGNVGIGVTSAPAAKLEINGQVIVDGMTQSSAAQSGTVCYNSGTGAITYDATLGCLSSSRRWKTDIQGIDVGLDEVMSLRPVSFKKKNKDPRDPGEHVGLIAEEVNEVDSRLVGLDDQGNPLGVRYSELTAVLIKAIQEQQKEIEEIQWDCKQGSH